MKLKSRFHPELAVSTDVGRYHISEPHLDVERKALIATNGQFLVSLPVDLEEGDTAGVIPLKALEMARAEAKEIRQKSLTAFDEDGCGPEVVVGEVIGKEPLSVRANGAAVLESGITVPRPTDVTFPEWVRVLPPPEKTTRRIGLSADLLKRISDAIGARNGQVTLDFDPADPLSAFVVRPAWSCDGAHGREHEKTGDEFGVLMPIRLPEAKS